MFVFDPIYVVNLILCIIIFVLGFLAYKSKRNKNAFYVGFAFALFGLSHLATLFELREQLTLILIGIRTLAYLTVVFALYKILKE
ncbi:MAG: hypothetical protein JW703_00120 [Candidatus Diapherotrites archaeon]|nr:hypothetical protein [Candidatus Diapherotrites archaeon]